MKSGLGDKGDTTRSGLEASKQPNHTKLSSTLIESMLTDPLYSVGKDDMEQNNMDLFNMGIEDLRKEFGADALTNTDIRRAIRKVGDVMMVDRVRFPKSNRHPTILSGPEYRSLRNYIRDYVNDTGVDVDKIFRDADPDNDNGSPDLPQPPNANQSTPEHSLHELYEWEDEDGEKQSPGNSAAEPLQKGKHHSVLVVDKWRNVRFEKTTRLGDYNLPIDTRVTRICGARYPRANRTRTASLCEFSTEFADDCIRSGGTHTVGLERASWSQQKKVNANGNHENGNLVRRRFTQVNFFATVGLGGTGQTLYLAHITPLAVREVDGLTILKRTRRGERQTLEDMWIDAEDIVDLIGLIYCEGDEYVCWRDACWDAVKRQQIAPLDWRFRDRERAQAPLDEEDVGLGAADMHGEDSDGSEEESSGEDDLDDQNMPVPFSSTPVSKPKKRKHASSSSFRIDPRDGDDSDSDSEGRAPRGRRTMVGNRGRKAARLANVKPVLPARDVTSEEGEAVLPKRKRVTRFYTKASKRYREDTGSPSGEVQEREESSGRVDLGPPRVDPLNPYDDMFD